MYLHFALQAVSLSRDSSSEVTIFSDGPIDASKTDMNDALEIARSSGCRIDERRIARLVPSKAIGVNLEFQNGQKADVGLLVHKPPTALVSVAMVQDLGVEIEQSPLGPIIKKSEPFWETNVKGVFVAGDAGTQTKQVTIAMSSGRYQEYGPGTPSTEANREE